MEGLYIPMLKLAEGGRLNETLMAMIRANTRMPVDTEGDVYSLANCNDVGCRRLVDMMDEFELGDLDRLADHICERSRERRAGRRSPAAAGHLDEQDDRRRLRRADRPRRRHRPSATRASTSITPAPASASQRGINVPMAYTTAYTVFGLGCVVALAHTQQRRLAGAAHGVGARGLHPQRAEAEPGR